MLKLEAGDMEIEVEPRMGGSIVGWRRGDVPLMRPRAQGAVGPLHASSCFPLVPYANRIAHGRFQFSGQNVVIAPNMVGHDHPLHGEGWLAPWMIKASNERSVELELESAGGEWPWPYQCTQSIALDERGLTLRLEIRNISNVDAPIGLGFHPYFPSGGQARIRANVKGVWLTDSDLPKRHVEADELLDLSDGASLPRATLIDHCYSGWDGRAEISLSQTGPRIRMTADPSLGYLHIYAPPGESFFCVEPVSHRPNAHNAEEPQREGVRVLAPVARTQSEVRFDVF